MSNRSQQQKQSSATVPIYRPAIEPDRQARRECQRSEAGARDQARGKREEESTMGRREASRCKNVFAFFSLSTSFFIIISIAAIMIQRDGDDSSG